MTEQATTDKSCCWSITINNPTPDDLVFTPKPGWRLQGQMEKGKEGTLHYQGMLTTPHIRFSAVKKEFPRAHIEVARDKKALAKYVSKEDTRVALSQEQMNIFKLQTAVSTTWNEEEFTNRYVNSPAYSKLGLDDTALAYIDSLTARLIRQGHRAIEFIAVNPIWRSSWKKFWRDIITRNASSPKDEPTPPPDAPPSQEDVLDGEQSDREALHL